MKFLHNLRAHFNCSKHLLKNVVLLCDRRNFVSTATFQEQQARILHLHTYVLSIGSGDYTGCEIERIKVVGKIDLLVEANENHV